MKFYGFLKQPNDNSFTLSDENNFTFTIMKSPKRIRKKNENKE